MERNIEDEVRLIEASIHGEQGKPGEEEPEEEIYHVYDVPGGIVILREGEIPGAQNATVIDSEPPETELQTNIPTTPLPGKTPVAAHVTISLYLLLILSCLMFQIYVLINPFTVTVTLAARSQQVTVTGTLQLGRLLNPITISQSATVNTTGHAHQEAKAATGYITFYNGLFTSQTVAAGTILTGSDGVQVIIDQLAIIPAATENIPPIYGQVTVPAHALNTGTTGNIAADDIHQTCCLPSVLVENATAFHGGQDERNFTIVTQADINSVSTLLKTTLNQSTQGALTGQLKSGEAIKANPCSPTVTPDHPLGAEATQVKVTVSETCSAVAYNQDTLQAKVLLLLTAQAAKKVETGYSILGNPQITVTSATASKQVILSFTSISTWIYALSNAEQKHIKKIIAGKSKEQATQLLNRLPGIERVSLQFAGFGDDTRIPKNLSNIHLNIFYSV